MALVKLTVCPECAKKLLAKSLYNKASLPPQEPRKRHGDRNKVENEELEPEKGIKKAKYEESKEAFLQSASSSPPSLLYTSLRDPKNAISSTRDETTRINADRLSQSEDKDVSKSNAFSDPSASLYAPRWDPNAPNTS